MIETMSEPLDGLAIARQRIAEEAEAQTGFLDLGGLSLTALPAELFRLQHLRELNLGADILREDGSYHHAYDAWRDNPNHNEIEPEYFESLQALPDLVGLSITATPVADLTPLSGLALQSLSCGSTQVSDLTPLSGLAALQSLDCSFTQVSDLTPLSGLAALQSVNCYNTQVTDLTPLSGLAALQSLDCSFTQVSDLTPLAGLAALQSLNCRATRVSDLTPQAAVLLDRLAAWIERRSGRGGLQAKRIGSAIPASAKPDEDDKPLGTFGPAPVAATEYFVSYAWGDDTSPEGSEREAIVDRLCTAAEAHGISIVRDKTTLRFGDRITPFMRRIGAGDRIFVILSEKYFRSAWCMFELCEIWFYSRRDEADFRRRVRIYALPDVHAATVLDRGRLAAFWQTQHRELEALIHEHGAQILATADFERFKSSGRLLPPRAGHPGNHVRHRTTTQLRGPGAVRPRRRVT